MELRRDMTDDLGLGKWPRWVNVALIIWVALFLLVDLAMLIICFVR